MFKKLTPLLALALLLVACAPKEPQAKSDKANQKPTVTTKSKTVKTAENKTTTASKSEKADEKAKEPPKEVSAEKTEAPPVTSEETVTSPYQEVFDRLNSYREAGLRKDFDTFDTLLASQAEEEMILARAIFNSADYFTYQYSLVDLNGDGNLELLIGTPNEVVGIYALASGRPSLLQTASVAPAGGHRSFITILATGDYIYSVGHSLQAEHEVSHFRIVDGTALLLNTATYLIGTDRPESKLGLEGVETFPIDSLLWESLS